MKKSIFIIALLIGNFISSNAQQSNWELPKINIPLVTEGEEIANLGVEKSLEYADLNVGSKSYRILLNNSSKKCKIIDLESDQVLAEGKSLNSFQLANLTFTDGEVFNFEKKKKKEGYDIIGPSGLLFSVENRGLASIEVNNEKELIAQSIFVFKRLRDLYRQTPVVYNYYTDYYSSLYN
ncbi:hypothetical protein JYB62_00970 [Algoriphagus lutimaris]|uniref:hypothetical protein n=1 Tax=Algoriphagus lutimaris TaxID=613197 RepID=UPI00196AF768|nr:hypothetical protein [Algoriphagus lutimaris]MBN3518558.1 hypothetical protein [Algoriphagus lutimaris]